MFLTYLNFFSPEEKVMTVGELIFVMMFLAQALNSIKNFAMVALNPKCMTLIISRLFDVT